MRDHELTERPGRGWTPWCMKLKPAEQQEALDRIRIAAEQRMPSSRIGKRQSAPDASAV